MSHAATISPEAVKSTRATVGEAVQTRSRNTERTPLPNPSQFASEDEFCEALLDSLFGVEGK